MKSPDSPSPAPRQDALSRPLVDLSMSALIVVLFSVFAVLKTIAPDALPWLPYSSLNHVGAEYNCIAKAIFEGRGYCDPFWGQAGQPTAWMPPVLPYIQASLYVLHGGSEIAVIFWMIALNLLSNFVTCFVILREGRRIHCYFAGLVIVLLVFASDFYNLFLQTHDAALLLLIVNGLWLGLNQLPHWRSVLAWIGWGLFGGFSALCSPIVGAAWFIATAFFVPKDPKPELQTNKLLVRRPLAICWIVALLAVTPWTIRNRVVLGKWMPIKSNGMYEIWQSQCLDDDGVIDMKFLGQHPWTHNGEQRARYYEIGETEFIREKSAEAVQSIYNSPMKFAERVLNRTAVVFMIYEPLDQSYQFRPLSWPMLFTRCIHPLPLLSIFALAIFAPIPVPRPIRVTVLLFLLLLIPYALVSYYDRYGTMCTGLKGLLMLYAFGAITVSLARRRSKAPLKEPEAPPSTSKLGVQQS